MDDEIIKEIVAAIIDIQKAGQVNPDTLDKLNEWYNKNEGKIHNNNSLTEYY